MSSAVPLYLSPPLVSTTTCNSKQVLQLSGTLCHSRQPPSLLYGSCTGQLMLSKLQNHNGDSGAAPLPQDAHQACRGTVAPAESLQGAA